jgi:tetratricopeptide (TPR) repeat protein
VLLAIGLGLQGADWPVKRGPSREPSPYVYDPATWKQVPREYLEDYPACTLFSSTSYMIEEDGTVETTVHEVTRLSGRKGIDKLGEYKNISFDPSFESLVLNEARVIKKDGRSIPIERRYVQLRDISTDYQVYDHDKQLIISFPNLEVGDTIEVKWTVRGKNPEYHGQNFGVYNFGDDNYPVAREELRIRSPRGRELKYATIGGKLEPVLEKEGETVLYRWKNANRLPLPQDDDLPPKDVLRLQVAFSTFSTWSDVADWKKSLRKDCWECNDEVREVVKEVTKDLTSPLDKARALTLWVRHNIRYVSVGETHAYTPHKPSFVLGSRYGDCKDQSQLLAVMLREAEVPVSLVTLGTRGDGQVLEDVPSPWGTHAILLVVLDGKEHWIDTTVSLAGWDFLPRDDRDRTCYLFDMENGVRVSRTPAMTADDNRVEQITRITIGQDGTSYCERSVSYHGSVALSQRDLWVEVPGGERRRLTAAELQDANSKSRLIDLKVDEKRLMDFDQPVTARMVFEIAGHFTGDPIKEGSVTDSKVWSKLLAYNVDFDRKSPMELWAPFESHHRYIIHLPQTCRLDTVPESRVVSSKWGTFRVDVKTFPEAPRKLELDFLTRFDKTLIEPQDFDDFRTFHEDLSESYRVWLKLRPTLDIEDALGLEVWHALAPADGSTASSLARLYLHFDRKADARRVLDRSCFLNPANAELWELKVHTAENLLQEEQAYRTLVRLFPQEGKYAVDLGSVLVQRGEHEQARKVLEPVAAKGPETVRAQAHYYLARNFLKQQKMEDALRHLEDAEDIDPDSMRNASVLGFKGVVLEKLGRDADAVRAYSSVLAHESDSTEALSALVRLCLTLKKTDDALGFLRRYTLAVGDDAEGLVRAAEYHLRMERYEDALELASRAREQKFDLRSQAVIGLVHFHRGDFSRAMFHLERAEPTVPVMEGLLRCCLRLDRLREAEELLSKANKLPEPNAGLLLVCAETATLLQRRSAALRDLKPPKEKMDIWRNAIDHYLCAEKACVDGMAPAVVENMLQQVSTEGIDYGPAHSLRGLLAVDRGRLIAANEEAEKAIALDPQDARAYLVRGRVRLERAAAGAQSDLDKAAQLTLRKDAVTLHWLAAAQLQANQREAALSTQREAARLSPNDPMVQEQLRQLEGK